MDTAPQDGSEIIGIYEDGTKGLIFWNEERYCMLGSRAGSYPPGWSPADEGVDRNLPLDEEMLVGWEEIGGE